MYSFSSSNSRSYKFLGNRKTNAQIRVLLQSSLASQAITSDPFVLELADTLDSLASCSSPPLALQKLRDSSSESILSTSWPSHKEEPFRFTATPSNPNIDSGLRFAGIHSSRSPSLLSHPSRHSFRRPSHSQAHPSDGRFRASHPPLHGHRILPLLHTLQFCALPILHRLHPRSVSKPFPGEPHRRKPVLQTQRSDFEFRLPN